MNTRPAKGKLIATGDLATGQHIAMTAAQRQAAYRARKGKQINLLLPDDVKEGLDAYIKRQHQDGQDDMTVSEIITKLLRAQLLRKR